jgi:hypothetical protein
MVCQLKSSSLDTRGLGFWGSLDGHYDMFLDISWKTFRKKEPLKIDLYFWYPFCFKRGMELYFLQSTFALFWFDNVVVIDFSYLLLLL